MNNHARTVPHIKANGPLLQVPAVVLVLIALLLLCYGGYELVGDDKKEQILKLFAFNPAQISAPPSNLLERGVQIWSFLTYAFLHGSWGHVLFNCLWLLVFGTIVARRLSWPKFCLLSALSAIAGAVAMLLSYWGVAVMVVGASAAVSGMMGAAVPIIFGRKLIIPNIAGRSSVFLEPLRPQQLWHNQRARSFIIITLLVFLLPAIAGFIPQSLAGEDVIAWQAHIGGFIAGLASFYWLDRISGLPPSQS